MQMDLANKHAKICKKNITHFLETAFFVMVHFFSCTLYMFLYSLLTIMFCSRLSDRLLTVLQQSPNVNLMQTSKVMSISKVVDPYLATDNSTPY